MMDMWLCLCSERCSHDGGRLVQAKKVLILSYYGWSCDTSRPERSRRGPSSRSVVGHWVRLCLSEDAFRHHGLGHGWSFVEAVCQKVFGLVTMKKSIFSQNVTSVRC